MSDEALQEIVLPRGYFEVEARNLGLLDSVFVGTYLTRFPVDSTQVLRVPSDQHAEDSFYCTLTGGLYKFLKRRGIYDDPYGAYQRRYYLNPCLSVSIQELRRKWSGPEFLVKPPESFRADEDVEVQVFRLAYDMDNVHKILDALIVEINLTRTRGKLRHRALLEQYDSLVGDVRREMPTFMPNY